ncbi:MAG: flagellin [Planctomycetota bacterium]|nr:flagellin [Planctomycetota bacterium]
MSRINTNVSALIAQHNLATSNADLQVRLQRLSTGLQINRGADNPAGLIVSERLRSEIAGITQSIDNVERASNVIATTEAALAEVSNLLTSVKSLVVQAANTGAFSKDEITANQLQIDSAVESITRIANTTSFAGLKLLNGNLDYTTSGVNSTDIQDVKVFGANFGTQSYIPVNVEVLNSAQTASLFISGNITGAAGKLLSSVAFEIAGTKGVQAFQFTSGTNLSAVAFAVNQVKDATGVSANLVNAADLTSGLNLTSSTLGSSAFVSVRRLQGGSSFRTFDQQGGSAINRTNGQDVLALVNGNLALGDGTKLTLHSSTLNVQLNLTTAAAQTQGTYNFAITGGGASYQVGGEVNTGQQVGFGIQSVAASSLGSEAIGFLNSIATGGANSLVAGQAGNASQIIDSALDQISLLRGRLGAFERNTLQTAVNSQQIALENLTSAESKIRDADFASETSHLTRSQILVQAGTSTLALANSTSQSVLKLLTG